MLIKILFFISFFLLILNSPSVKNINTTYSKYTNDEIIFLITFSQTISLNDFKNIFFIYSSNNIICNDLKILEDNLNIICKSTFLNPGKYFLFIDSINSTFYFDFQYPTLINFSPDKINSLNNNISFSFYFEESFKNILSISFGISKSNEINCNIENNNNNENNDNNENNNNNDNNNNYYSQINCSAIFQKEKVTYFIFIEDFNTTKTISVNDYSSLHTFLPTGIYDLNKIVLLNLFFSERVSNIKEISFKKNSTEIICYNPTSFQNSNDMQYICSTIFNEKGTYEVYISNIKTNKIINVYQISNFFKINLFLLIFIILLL